MIQLLYVHVAGEPCATAAQLSDGCFSQIRPFSEIDSRRLICPRLSDLPKALSENLRLSEPQ